MTNLSSLSFDAKYELKVIILDLSCILGRYLGPRQSGEACAAPRTAKH